jgi:ribosomal protein S21
MAVNCRAVLKPEAGRNPDEAFKIMLGKFRKKMTDAGVMTLWKSKQYYESKGERRRRKKKESISKRIKESKTTI